MITALSFNHPASPYQLWLPSSKIDLLKCSCISYAIAHKWCHAGLVPMLAPGGWWWVLVATSGSCGRWVLVGVMQIPDTGHGPHATRRLTSLPSMETRSFWNQDPKRWKIAAWRSGRVASGFRMRFPHLHLYDLRIIGTALQDGGAPVPVEF